MYTRISALFGEVCRERPGGFIGVRSPGRSIIVLLLLVAGCSGNVSESRGEPHRGQVTNAQWSAAAVDVYTGDGSRTRIQPGGASPKGRTYARFCIPPGYTGSATIATDDNPAGFPPVRVSGGGCHKLAARDVATVTVKR